MDWLSGMLVPVWLKNIATAAVGALLAYAAWNWLHSPHLYPSKVVHQDVVEVDEDRDQRSLRLEVQNIGTQAATNCEAVIHLRVPVEDDVVRCYQKIPWLPQRADLVVDDSDQGKQAGIPAGHSLKLELFRQYRNKNLQIYPKIGGDTFIRTSSGDEYHRPANVNADFAVLSPRGSNPSYDVQTSGKLHKEDILDADWQAANAKVVIETESARPLEISLDLSADDEGNLMVGMGSPSGRRRYVNGMYRVLNRLRSPT